MDSQGGIGGGPSRRITRSWYPGGKACTRRTTGIEAAASCSRGTSWLGTNVGYWGRVDTQGEFKASLGFLEPMHPSRFPWRSLCFAIRRILPLSVAALVGAVTALAWQSFVIRPAQPLAGRPILPAPAVQGLAAVRTGNGAERPPADLPPISGSTPALAVPAPTWPTQEAPIGSAPKLAASPAKAEVERSASARPNDRLALPYRTRSPALKVNPARAARPAVTHARLRQASDPDAILPPDFK